MSWFKKLKHEPYEPITDLMGEHVEWVECELTSDEEEELKRLSTACAWQGPEAMARLAELSQRKAVQERMGYLSFKISEAAQDGAVMIRLTASDLPGSCDEHVSYSAIMLLWRLRDLGYYVLCQRAFGEVQIVIGWNK